MTILQSVFFRSITQLAIWCKQTWLGFVGVAESKSKGSWPLSCQAQRHLKAKLIIRGEKYLKNLVPMLMGSLSESPEST